MAVYTLHQSIFESFERWTDHTSRGGSAKHRSRENDQSCLWKAHDTPQQLTDIVLYLLIWGEAANLRFMPELLFFLFAAARAHYLAQPAAPLAGADVEQTHFLESVVKPIYNCVFSETFKGLAKNHRPQPKGELELAKWPKNCEFVLHRYVLNRYVLNVSSCCTRHTLVGDISHRRRWRVL